MMRVVALTEAGRRLAERLCASLTDAEICFKPDPFAPTVQQAFRDGEPLLMICATGIVVRTLAPVISSKHDDPPVIVLDEAGAFVIPLLSGHEGGANELAAQIADLLGAQLVLTTANPYLQPVYAVGMGCERGCEQAELNELLQQCLQRAEITLECLASVNSIDVKADEAGLIDLCAALQKPFQVFTATELRPVEHLLSTRSDYVFETVGVYGVAESAALLAAVQAADGDAELVVDKQKSKRATCAVARAYPSNPEARGRTG
jgi:cobalt-precorrin 5A hydrolase